MEGANASYNQFDWNFLQTFQYSSYEYFIIDKSTQFPIKVFIIKLLPISVSWILLFLSFKEVFGVTKERSTRRIRPFYIVTTDFSVLRIGRVRKLMLQIFRRMKICQTLFSHILLISCEKSDGIPCFRSLVQNENVHSSYHRFKRKCLCAI